VSSLVITARVNGGKISNFWSNKFSKFAPLIPAFSRMGEGVLFVVFEEIPLIFVLRLLSQLGRG